MRVLNPGKLFEAAVHPHLAMYNFSGWDNQESLLFANNHVIAKRVLPWTGKHQWYEISTLDFRKGAPVGYPTWTQNPLFVQRFSVIGREDGRVRWRGKKLFYPLVSREPLFLEAKYLEAI